MTSESGREELSPRRHRTRRDILDGAVKEFLEKGYGGATLASVAARARVSTATLHKYFPSKRDLFGGVIERFFENGPDAAPPALKPGDPSANLTTAGRAYARLLLDETTVPLFRVLIAETICHPELGQALYEHGKEAYLDRLEGYVRAEQSAGRLEVADVAMAVRQFLGMINDIVFWPRMLVSDLSVSESDAERVVAEAVKTFLARYGR